jgi:hypothetical protein
MSSVTVSLFLVVAATAQSGRYYQQYGTIREDELKYQKEIFQHWWGQELAMKLTDLPAEGKVPDYRVPYAGHDYPDRMGGTVNALYKYDRAFNRGGQATEWERRDVSAHRRGGGGGDEFRRGLFGRLIRIRSGPRVPSWYGHCNGWTAAAIRHAEPQKNVVRNGVVFTPADIKGLLAEIYMYSATEHLGGLDAAINPGTLHLTLGNWLGLGSQPVGMEAAMGEVVINYPLYSYKATVHKHSDRQYEIRNVVNYVLNIPREVDKGPQQSRQMYFHYVLDLDAEGKITGGRYYGDSQRVDMLWTALKPVQAGEKGNERGNPHVSVKEVLALWRESVPEDLRDKWLNVDPTEEDAVLVSTPAAAEETMPTSTEASDAPPPPTSGAAAATAAPATPAPSAETTPAAEATSDEVPPPAPAAESTAPAAEAPAAPSSSAP